MTIASTTTSALDGLKERFGDRILLGSDISDSYHTDYGKVFFHEPGAVAFCHNTEEVAELVRYCRSEGLSITARGQGHSQSGQCTSRDHGVILDTSSMQSIHSIDAEGLTVTVDCGVVWRDLVKTVVPMGLVPPTLTNNLGVSISGTLSIAGLGVASYRYGGQVDNVLELEVVTGTGEIVTCSETENQDLFDVVRSGFSQFALICRAKLRLRKCKPKVRKYFLLYDDLGALMRDSEIIMAEGNDDFHTLEAWCSPCPQGAKRIGEGMELGVGAQIFAYWMYPLHLTVEYDEGDEPDDERILGTLNPYRHLETCEYSQLEFCERLVPLFQLWDRSGYTDMAHPWMETVLPWEKAQEYIETVLSNLPPQSLGPGGHILLWPSRGDTSNAPLFMTPKDNNFVMGWGLLPAVPEQYLEQALAQLDMASELSIGYEGKRYLSGYITFDTPEKWAAHFGDKWPGIQAAKKKFDPDGILNPGFIQYE
ncbi:MAG: FAD-binding protein [Acidobacteriota bacterium]